MRLRYDAELDGVYIYLRDERYAWGLSLDDLRRIDYGPDDEPVGIDIIQVSRGVLLDDLPEQEGIARLLSEHDIPSYRQHGSTATKQPAEAPMQDAPQAVEQDQPPLNEDALLRSG